MQVMAHIKCFDHIGITVADLDLVAAFFAGLGLEVEGRTFVEGEFVDTVNELGLRNVSFEVDDLRAAVDWAATEGYGLVGGIGEYEGAVRMAYVRGPEGLIVSLFEQVA
jgi:catechol 2,3-dioxygenase-like lactoylglutathione lyase family enzyme